MEYAATQESCGFLLRSEREESIPATRGWGECRPLRTIPIFERCQHFFAIRQLDTTDTPWNRAAFCYVVNEREECIDTCDTGAGGTSASLNGPNIV